VSEEQIGIVKRVLAAVGERDFATLRELAAPDIVLRPLLSVWPRPYTGIDGLELWWKDVEELWSDFTIEDKEIRELDADTLLVSVEWRGLPRGTAAEVSGPGAAVIRFRDGKGIYVGVFLDEASALESLEADGD
jgi:ketosteroid isomerase-like protein